MPDAADLLGVRINHRMPPLPEPIRRIMDTERLYIYNVSPKEFRLPFGPLGTLVIPACPEGAEYSAPVKFMGKDGIPAIIPQAIVTNVDGTRVEHDWDTKMEGKHLVKDILGFGENDRRRQGVFQAAGRVPTEQETATARQQFYDRCAEWVKANDDAYEINAGQEVGENGRPVSAISSDGILGCKVLGLDRPWLRKSGQKQTICDECGTGNLPTAAFCKSCDNLLNEEAAKRKFPAKYAERVGAIEPVPTEAPQKRGPGRPPKVEV